MGETGAKGTVSTCHPLPINHPPPHLTARCEDTVYEVIRGDHN